MRHGFLVLTFALALFASVSRSPAADVVLEQTDLIRFGPGIWNAIGFRLPGEDRTLPVIGPDNDEDGAQLLRSLVARGKSHGFGGFLYDNRDRGHSTLRQSLFPRLLYLRYDKPLRDLALDYGLAGRVMMPTVVFGNSSTAITAGPFRRSQPRDAMTRPDKAEASVRLYLNNSLYVYPEHRDHDEADLFPANWPYMIVSQGSSGSDRRFLSALAMTLAAFPEDTFARLTKTGLVAPTLQMILRRNLTVVPTREFYLTGAAHPVAFDKQTVRPARMVAQASQMRPEDIPPMVRLRVESEDFNGAAGLAGLSERLFDTPSAIARIWRGYDWQREMTVSAAETADPNGRPLSFEWRLLHGDPTRVDIAPLSEDGARARIRVAWHDTYLEPVYGSTELRERKLSRVDIGVFANNGAQDSAPAFISISFPTHQRRIYTPDDSGSVRLRAINYDAVAREVYYDPLLHWSAPWTDVPDYGPDGAIAGWERRSTDGRTVSVPVAGGAAAGYRIDRAEPAKPVLRLE